MTANVVSFCALPIMALPGAPLPVHQTFIQVTVPSSLWSGVFFAFFRCFSVRIHPNFLCSDDRIEPKLFGQGFEKKHE